MILASPEFPDPLLGNEEEKSRRGTIESRTPNDMASPTKPQPSMLLKTWFINAFFLTRPICFSAAFMPQQPIILALAMK